MVRNGYLMSFRPPAAIQFGVAARRLLPGTWYFHRIENAYGPINVDEYSVNITQMPLAANVVPNPLSLDNPARRATPAELVQRIRMKFNSFVDSRLAGFEPYDLVPDAAIWSLQVPLGAVIHIDMRDPRGEVFPFNNPDDGSVCVTAAGPEYWRFSTLATPADGEHPVSGNREFGIEPWGPAGTFIESA